MDTPTVDPALVIKIIGLHRNHKITNRNIKVQWNRLKHYNGTKAFLLQHTITLKMDNFSLRNQN